MMNYPVHHYSYSMFPGEVFANTADFDTGIRQLLPRYDEMLDVVVSCLPPNTRRILELGCGTGELSLKLLKRFPQAQLVALDYSPRMIEFAKQKVSSAEYAQRWHGIKADFGAWADHQLSLEKGFDACVSSLAIHHLSDQMKLKLFQRIHQSLISHGCFWNADPTLPESPMLAEVNQAAREAWVTQQGTTLAAVRTQLGQSTNYGYSSQDQLATLTAHLQMLTTAGFKPVAVPWKYFGLAVFGGYASADPLLDEFGVNQSHKA